MVIMGMVESIRWVRRAESRMVGKTYASATGTIERPWYASTRNAREQTNE